MSEKTTYTAFCQEAGGTGTIWIDKVEADSVEEGALQARRNCAREWGHPLYDVHCLGLATGAVEIAHWEDICDSSWASPTAPFRLVVGEVEYPDIVALDDAIEKATELEDQGLVQVFDASGELVYEAGDED